MVESYRAIVAKKSNEQEKQSLNESTFSFDSSDFLTEFLFHARVSTIFLKIDHI